MPPTAGEPLADPAAAGRIGPRRDRAARRPADRSPAPSRTRPELRGRARDRPGGRPGDERLRQEAFDVAWRFLAHRDRTEAEVAARLRSASDVDPALVEEVVAALLEGGYVDDAGVRPPLRRGPAQPRRLGRGADRAPAARARRGPRSMIRAARSARRRARRARGGVRAAARAASRTRRRRRATSSGRSASSSARATSSSWRTTRCAATRERVASWRSRRADRGIG